MPGRSRLLSSLAAALCAAAVLASASGCSGAADAATPAPAPTPTVLDSTGLRLPVAAYLLSPDTQLQLDKASQALVKQCMKRYGLTYADSPAAPRSAPATITEMRYGVTNPEQARTTGYHFGPANPGYLPPSKETAPPENTDPGYQLVLNGNGTPGKSAGTPTPYGSQTVQPGGCMGEMGGKLTAGATFLGEASLIHQIDGQSFSESLKAPAVQTVFQAWSACMLAKGHHYATPMDAVNDPAFSKPALGKDEQQTAQADVACKQQSNVVGVWFTAEVDRQNTLMAQHKDELRTINIQMQKQAAVFAEVLRTAG